MIKHAPVRHNLRITRPLIGGADIGQVNSDSLFTRSGMTIMYRAILKRVMLTLRRIGIIVISTGMTSVLNSLRRTGPPE